MKPIYGANLDTSMLEHFYQIWGKIFGAVLGTPCLGLFGVYGHVNVNRLPAEHTFHDRAAETKLYTRFTSSCAVVRCIRVILQIVHFLKVLFDTPCMYV